MREVAWPWRRCGCKAELRKRRLGRVVVQGGCVGRRSRSVNATPLAQRAGHATRDEAILFADRLTMAQAPLTHETWAQGPSAAAAAARTWQSALCRHSGQAARSTYTSHTPDTAPEQELSGPPAQVPSGLQTLVPLNFSSRSWTVSDVAAEGTVKFAVRTVSHRAAFGTMVPPAEQEVTLQAPLPALERMQASQVMAEPPLQALGWSRSAGVWEDGRGARGMSGRARVSRWARGHRVITGSCASGCPRARSTARAGGAGRNHRGAARLGDDDDSRRPQTSALTLSASRVGYAGAEHSRQAR